MPSLIDHRRCVYHEKACADSSTGSAPRCDIPDEVKQKVICALDWFGTRTGQHENNARTALDVVADVPHPRILELGAGHGKLSAQILSCIPARR
jgi:hypothetical protein